jgi:phosphate-selective porin OprO/OprP
MEFGKGIQFTSADSTFTLAIGGRIQSLFEARRDITNETSGADFLLRRCRLNFQGTAFNPKFSYRIQLGFAHGDIFSSNSTVQNNLILRDAMLFYDAKKWLRIGFGQTKLPGNRQRQVSSANLQLVERSIANNHFTLDRDKGVWFYTKFDINKTVLKSTIAISSGEGRIVSDKNGKLCYSARMEFLPFGEFSNKGDYIEADIDREKKPKLSIAGAYSYNDQATRTMGQLGDYLYNSEKANIDYYGADVLFKYNGFSLESELYNRTSNTGVIVSTIDSKKSNYVVSGTTFMVQSGYFLSKKNEIAIRYAQINPETKVASVMPEQKEYVVGFSHYFNRHSLKIQNDLSYFQTGPNNSLVFRLSGVVTF